MELNLLSGQTIKAILQKKRSTVDAVNLIEGIHVLSIDGSKTT